MKVETFYDYRFRARHSMQGRSESAAHTHWHSYVVRFWFNKAHDQDWLSREIEGNNLQLQAADLDTILTDTSDEGLAQSFLKHWAPIGCIRVTVTNDERRGAEASL